MKASTPNSTALLVGYIRVSSVGGRTDERFKSPGLQREAMERWAERRYGSQGYEWIGWFSDLDRSGVSIDRPELLKAKEAATTRGAAIVVYDYSRWSRNLPEGTAALQSLRYSSVEVHSATEDVDRSTPEGELNVNMLMLLSDYQAKTTGKRWRELIASNRRHGLWHGVPPFGYRRLTAVERERRGRGAGVIVLDAVNAARVQRMFERYLDGDTCYAIGRDAVDRGWFTRIETAKAILSNPAYAGLVPIDASYEVRRSVEGEILRDNHGRPRHRRVDARYCRGAHDAIVSTRTFVMVRRRLRAEGRGTPGRVQAARWSAARRTKCLSCGRSLVYDDKSATATDGRYLKCQNRRCAARPGSVRVTELERYIDAGVQVLGASLHTRSSALLRSSSPAAHKEVRVRTELEERLRKVQGALLRAREELLRAEPEDTLEIADLEAVVSRFRDERAELHRALEDQPDRAASPPVQWVELVDEFRRLWPDMTFDERTAALAAIGVEVVVGPSTRRAQSLVGRVTFRVSWEETSGSVDIAVVAEPTTNGCEDVG